MNSLTKILCSAVMLLFCIPSATRADNLPTNSRRDSKPNIIFILADDLGYGDLGCYGQEIIQTPQIDQMAREGMRFTDFYSGSTVCAPSRCVLMTGKHLGRAHVRGNAGGDMRIQSLRDADVTVAEVLKQSGYQTALCGKWGLGETTKSDRDNPGLPNKQGFDLFFGYQSQHHAHNYYPAFLWRNTEQVQLRNEVVQVQGRKRPDSLFVPGHATKRVDYSHDLIMNEALGFIRQNKGNAFFLYLAVTIPHANNEGAKATGDGQEIPDYGIYAEREGWTDPDRGQAAMITHLDTGVGEILSLLKELEIDENTIVMFTSDNGHHDEGNHNTDLFNPNGALRGMKRDLYEGGIRVPMIVRWPGNVTPGSTTDHIGYFGDLMATTTEVLGQPALEGLNSVSFLPTLLGNVQVQQQHEYLYWEFYERGSKQAIRVGNWKAVRAPMITGEIELFDLANDLGETTNVAESNSDVVKKVEALFEEAHEPNPNWKIRGKPKSRGKAGSKVQNNKKDK